MKTKTVLVTGASRGIGKSIALFFAKNQYNMVINCAKQETLLLEVKSEIESYGVSCLAFVGDIGQYEIAKELFIKIEHQYKSIDVLVNNAGISHIGLFTDLTPAEWNHILQTNLTSVYNCCSLSVPSMVSKKQGKIINISSVWGSVGASCEVAYSTSKGGMNSLTKALAKELAPSNIQVNAIACGAIDTEMNHFLSEEDKTSLIDEIPANRLGRPEEVAALVYQLAENNNYLTGQIITLDGGWT